MPSIKEELSLINSVYELKDLKSVRSTLSNIWGFARNIHIPRNSTLRRGLRASSDGFLQSQFNLLPMLSDIVGVNRAISRVEAQVNALLTRSLKLQRKHFRFSWREFDDSDDHTDAFYMFPSNKVTNRISTHAVTRHTVHESSLFHAMVEYNFSFTQYQREHALMLALLDAFGVNLNPRIIWNAIPWSFVVDWLVGVGRWLDNFKIQNMEPKITIQRYLWSIKRERNIYMYKVSNHYARVYSGHSGYPSPVLMPVVTETAYRRKVGVPSISSFLTTSGLSSNELALSTALVLARRR
jgi:hypothetical protein